MNISKIISILKDKRQYYKTNIRIKEYYSTQKSYYRGLIRGIDLCLSLLGDISFREFLDFIVIKDKRTGKIIYPNESMKSRMYNRYKMFVKWKNFQKGNQNPLI